PLVYLLATAAGGLALVVHAAGVEAVWLDDFNEAHLRELLVGPAGGPGLGGWFGAYAAWHDNYQAWLDTLAKVTGQLWPALMGPVVDCLTELGASEAVLIPAGLLALLPLHAAWTVQNGRRQYALDRVAFSYAPSARALTHARRLAAASPGESLLAVDEPQPVTGGGPLPNSEAEVAAIAALFDAPQVVRGQQATRQALLAALPQAQVVHFSCHGATNWAAPLHSGLLMAGDEMLTVQDTLGLHLAGARLATLSACETGLIGADLPDEVVALPAAFVQAGFAGVVASLWSVAEISTAMLMERFYRLWRHDGLSPALALREAQRWLRDTTNRQKADYFRRDIPVLSGLKMPEPIAADFFSRVMSHEQGPEARSFEHPFWWAAFYLTGA
ncbi:MAG: CHAT domain-containing protein, partial [Anaerolineae bacterium]